MISSLRKLPLTVQDVQSGGMYAGTEHKPAGVRKRVTLPLGKALAAVVATLRFSHPGTLDHLAVRSNGGLA